MGDGAQPRRIERPCERRGAVSRPFQALASMAVALAVAGCGGESGDASGRPLEVVATIGSVGLWPGQFATPRAIDTDGSALWVIDKAARVQKIDAASGEPLVEWKTPRHENGMPVGVTCTTLAGRRVVMVADTHESRVLVYGPGEDPKAEAPIVAEFGSYGTGPGQFIYPTDVVVVEDPAFGTRVYVSEYGGDDRVSVFNERFEFQFAFGRFGTGDHPTEIEFNRPQSMVFDEVNRELVVVDACNHRIGRFTPDGALIAWIGSPESAGAELGHFKYPYSLALLDDGTALVVEYENGRVQRIDMKTGRGLETYGRPGRGVGELVTPWSIVLIDRTAYVLDTGNNRVQVFRSPRAGQVRSGEASMISHGPSEPGRGS